MNVPTIHAMTHADMKIIIAALGISRQACNKRARKEAWPFIEQSGRGGKKHLYPVAGLPKVVARKVQAKAAILAMKAIREAKKEDMPDTFLVVLDAEVYEIRKVRP